MQINQETRKTIILSLISSAIFLIFLQPILTFFWTVIEKISLSTYTTLIDNLYKNAALGKRNWIDFIIFSFIIISAPTALITSRLIINHRRKLLNKDFSTVDKKSKKINIKKINDYLLLPIFILCSIYLLTFAYVDLNLNTSFHQRLNVLRPYINNEQEEMLISKWALMKNRIDFELIDLEMQDLAKQNNLILPENLIE